MSMDVEADLGIDSIKRVEILGSLQDQLPDLPELKAEDLAELRTLVRLWNTFNRLQEFSKSPHVEKPLLQARIRRHHQPESIGTDDVPHCQ